MYLRILYFVMVGVELSALIWGQPSFAIDRAGEDGTFYVQIAQNMALGHGVTFDGVTPTNGIHWLWLFVLAGVYKAVPLAWITDPDTLFQVSGVVYFSVLAIAGLLVARLSNWLTAILFVAYLANRGYWYMETHMVFLTLAALYLARNTWQRITAAALLVLARTDMVVWCLIFATAAIWIGWQHYERTILRVFPILVGGVFGFGLVCGLNYWVDHSVVSVSAQIKSAGFNNFGDIWRAGVNLWRDYFPVQQATAALAVLFIVSRPLTRWKDNFLASGFPASCGVLVMHVLHNSEVVGWYLAPVFLTSVLCSSQLFNSPGDWLRLFRQHARFPRLVGLSGFGR